jgi:hypothetical protein
MSNAKRQFRPIFTATITPGEVVRATSSTGTKYSTMKGSLVEREGKEPQTRTVMAFGKSNAAVARRLRAGRPLTVACQFDGGVVRIVGWVRKPEEVAAAA